MVGAVAIRLTPRAARGWFVGRGQPILYAAAQKFSYVVLPK